MAGNKHKNSPMVSIKSATWTAVLIKLVLSCAAVIASLAVVSALAQSVVPDGETPRFHNTFFN